MAGYTAIAETGAAIVELLRREMAPVPVSKPELIRLCSPYEPEDCQLTVHLFHLEENLETEHGYRQEGQDQQRLAPILLDLYFLVTAHSKAPSNIRASDEYRILGRAVQVLRDYPQIRGDLLSGSLGESDAVVQVWIEKVEQEQMQKLWDTNSRPSKASIVIRSLVSVDSERVRKVGRVRDVEVTLDERTTRSSRRDL